MEDNESGFSSIGNIINEIIRDKGWQEKIMAVQMPEVWAKIVGEKLAKVSKVSRFENGRLEVETKSSTWAMEIRLRSDEIKSKMNNHFKKNIIDSIMIK